jgi:hypothetical protein
MISYICGNHSTCSSLIVDTCLGCRKASLDPLLELFDGLHVANDVLLLPFLDLEDVRSSGHSGDVVFGVHDFNVNTKAVVVAEYVHLLLGLLLSENPEVHESFECFGHIAPASSIRHDAETRS